MNFIIGVMVWMMSPFYFTYQFLRYMFIDFWESLNCHMYDEYYLAYKDLYLKTRRVHSGEIDWMGNRLKNNEIKEEDIYKR